MRPWIAALALLALVPLASASSRHVRLPDAGPAGQDAAAHDELTSRITANLDRHVEGKTLAAWLETLPDGSLEAEAARWILAWLPLADLVALDLPLLQEHVDGAAQSYREAPWREKLPRELWLRFVVPQRVSQEPLQSWRRRFHDEIWPRVAGAPDMEHAALEVNRWCREQATFTSTSGRDAGPLSTLARGLGRCEEEMILTICALRSVGIPARSCATPYWPFTDNNHAWVEVWADGRWYYLGGCEPGACLDEAWFTDAARRAGFVRSVGYGEFAPGDEPLYRAELGSTLINSTRVYTRPLTLTARIAGGADPAAEIFINVLNFGSLRSIAGIRSGESIELGPGDYALTAELDGALLLEVSGGRSGDRIAAVLDASDRYDFAASPGFWLHYPEADQAPRRALKLVSEAEQTLTDLRVRARQGDRRKLREMSAEERAALDAMDPATRARVEAILALPMERISTVFLLMDAYPQGEAREALLAFLEGADDKDLLELDERGIRSHVDRSLEARKRMETLGLSVPDSLFSACVLAGRIEREPAGPWREGLPLWAPAGDPAEDLAALLARFGGRMGKVETGFFGPPLAPDQSWRLGLGSERDLAIALVGLLRRHGYPARTRHGLTEVWLGAWRALDPERAAFVEHEDLGADGKPPAGSGRLEIAITRGGLPYAEAEPYRDFMISRRAGGELESPWWEPVLGEQDWDAGDYVLSTALRVPGGDVYGRLRAFSVSPGKSTRAELPLDLDAAGWNPASLLSGMDSDSLFTLILKSQARDGEGRMPPESALFFLFTPGEPAERMITSLGRLRARLDRVGLPFVPVLLLNQDAPAAQEPPSGIAGASAEEADPWRRRIAEAGWPDHLWVDESGAFITKNRAAAGEGESASGEFAPLLMLRIGDRMLLSRQGFDPAADGLVHLALDGLEGKEP